MAEINSWNLAWTCAAAYTFLRLAIGIRAGGAGRPDRTRRAAALWGLVCGLGLAHHLTSVFLSASLTAGLLALLVRRRQFALELPLLAAAAALPPLAGYGFIAWRAWHPVRAQWELLDPNLASVFRHITGAQYHHYLGRFAPVALEKDLLATAVYPFLFPGLALLLLGVLRAGDAERRIERAALLAAALLATVFTFRYGVPDPAPYFLPAMALGVAAAAPAVAAIPGAGSRGGPWILAAAVLASLFLIVPWLKDGSEARAGTIDYDRMVRSMWSAIPNDSAIVSWNDDRYHRLVEYQVLRGEKPAIMVYNPDMFFVPSIRRAMRERFGVDPFPRFPLRRVTPGSPDEFKIIDQQRQHALEDLNARIRVPIILFDPSVPIVWQMRKPWEPRESQGTGPRPPAAHWAHPAFQPGGRR